MGNRQGQFDAFVELISAQYVTRSMSACARMTCFNVYKSLDYCDENGKCDCIASREISGWQRVGSHPRPIKDIISLVRHLDTLCRIDLGSGAS